MLGLAGFALLALGVLAAFAYGAYGCYQNPCRVTAPGLPVIGAPNCQTRTPTPTTTLLPTPTMPPIIVPTKVPTQIAVDPPSGQFAWDLPLIDNGVYGQTTIGQTNSNQWMVGYTQAQGVWWVFVLPPKMQIIVSGSQGGKAILVNQSQLDKTLTLMADQLETKQPGLPVEVIILPRDAGKFPILVTWTTG